MFSQKFQTSLDEYCKRDNGVFGYEVIIYIFYALKEFDTPLEKYCKSDNVAFWLWRYRCDVLSGIWDIPRPVGYCKMDDGVFGYDVKDVFYVLTVIWDTARRVL